MKILFTLHYNFDSNAGAAGVTWRLGQEYQRLGHEVLYYSLDNLPRKLHRLAKFATFPGFVAHHISTSLSQAVDVVDASTSDAWLWAAIQRNRKNRPLLITRCHGLEHIEHLEYLAEVQRGNLRLSWIYPLYRGSVRLWESETSMRYADLVLLLNRHDAKYAVGNLGVNPDRTRIVTNGIPETFLQLPFEPTPAAEDATIRIAQVSSYILRKGIHYGSPALNSILNRYPQVQVSFLGTECPAADVYADFDPAVRDRIQVVPYYSHETLPTLLKGHQIKLFPTISEGFGVALVEAMACGLAPITTMTPGPMEIVRDGHDAIVVPCRQIWAIEQALEQLITNRPQLEQLRRNAYATAQRYSWVRIARDNISLYEEALCQRKCSSMTT